MEMSGMLVVGFIFFVLLIEVCPQHQPQFSPVDVTHLEASSQLASRMRGHLEESSVRANSYRQLYADAEEAADRVEEARHGGVQSRIASLTRANATLQLQLQSAECRRRNIEEELER